MNGACRNTARKDARGRGERARLSEGMFGFFFGVSQKKKKKGGGGGGEKKKKVGWSRRVVGNARALLHALEGNGETPQRVLFIWREDVRETGTGRA